MIRDNCRGIFRRSVALVSDDYTRRENQNEEGKKDTQSSISLQGQFHSGKISVRQGEGTSGLLRGTCEFTENRSDLSLI